MIALWFCVDTWSIWFFAHYHYQKPPRAEQVDLMVFCLHKHSTKINFEQSVNLCCHMMHLILALFSLSNTSKVDQVDSKVYCLHKHSPKLFLVLCNSVVIHSAPYFATFFAIRPQQGQTKSRRSWFTWSNRLGSFFVDQKPSKISKKDTNIIWRSLKKR